MLPVRPARPLSQVMAITAVAGLAIGLPQHRPVPVIGVVSAIRIDTAMVPTSAETAALTRPWCGDRAFELEPWKVSGSFAWSYNPAAEPAAVAGSARAAIETATEALVSGRNDCGLPRPFRADARYLGRTRTAVGVSASGECAANDGRSVAGWKRLSSDALAITCTYYYPGSGTVASSDVAINTRYRWFVDRPAACSGAFDLVGVLTHERGHTFGLSHVRSANSPGQTMDSSIAPCSVAERTLAGGDHAGMRRLYGTA